MHTEQLTKQVSKFIDGVAVARRRRARARHLHTAGRLLATGLRTMALVSLARDVGRRRNGRAAALLAGAYLTHVGRRRRHH